MSLDRRLRDGLHDAAVGTAPDVERHLARVLTRHRRRTRARRSASVLAAALVVVAVALGVPSVTSGLREDDASVLEPAPPPSLPGTYVVDVPTSAAAESDGMTGRWVVVLGPDGDVDVTPPPGFRGVTSGITYRTDGDLLRIDAFISDPVCQGSQVAGPVGTYRWARSATRLQLEAVDESCAARELLFAGQPWQVLR
jgi:hypothetical protein